MLELFKTRLRAAIDDAKDGGPGRSDVYVVFTMMLCGLNYCIW